MFKSAFIVMAPDGDPEKHRTTITTGKAQVTTVVIELMNFNQAANVCRDLVQKEGVQSFILCPGFTHEAIAEVAEAAGEGVPINVARGDVPSTMITGQILTKEGWL